MQDANSLATRILNPAPYKKAARSRKRQGNEAREQLICSIQVVDFDAERCQNRRAEMSRFVLTPRQSARLARLWRLRKDGLVERRMVIAHWFACGFAVLFVALSTAAIAQNWPIIAVWLMGFLLGVFCAFAGALKDKIRSWPILDQIVDWNRVEEYTSTSVAES